MPGSAHSVFIAPMYGWSNVEIFSTSTSRTSWALFCSTERARNEFNIGFDLAFKTTQKNWISYQIKTGQTQNFEKSYYKIILTIFKVFLNKYIVSLHFQQCVGGKKQQTGSSTGHLPGNVRTLSPMHSPCSAHTCRGF